MAATCPETGCDREVEHRTYEYDPTPSSDLPVQVGEDGDGDPITVDPDDVLESDEPVTVTADDGRKVTVTDDDVLIDPAGPTEEYVCKVHGIVSPEE